MSFWDDLSKKLKRNIHGRDKKDWFGSAASPTPAAVAAPAPATDPLMEEQRRLAFGRLDELRNFYNADPMALQLQSSLQARMSGQDVPFSQAVRNALLAGNSDAGASQVAGDQAMIRQAMANAGLGGSGIETSAILNARRAASKVTRAERRNITSRAELENFNARTAAQQQAQNYLLQKQQAMAQAGQHEVDLRSQMTNVQNEGQAAPSTQAAQADQARIDMLRQKYAGQNPFLKELSWRTPGNTASSLQNVGFGQMAPVADMNAYNNKVMALQQQAAAWDSDKAAFLQKHGY